MVKNGHGGEERVGKIDGQRPSDAAEKMYKQRISQQPVVRKAPEQQQAPEKAAPKMDQFHGGERIPKFLKSVQNRLDGSWVFQSFKLPGTNYIVRDMRGEVDQGEALRMAAEYEMKEGKLAKAKKKEYKNYLGERQVLQPGEKKHEAEVSRLLSEFEKLLVKRFEEDVTVEQESKDGKSHFLEKSDEDWLSFFGKFKNRSEWHKIDQEALRKLIYRGLVSLKKGDGKYSMLIGDLSLVDGSVQKFVRLKVVSDFIELTRGKNPGEELSAEMLKKRLSSDEIKYLMLAHRHKQEYAKTGRRDTGGMFGKLRTEEYVARELGIKKGYNGPVAWGGEGKKPEGFIPQKFGMPNIKKSYSKVILIAAAAIFLLAILVLIYIL